jgi:methyltransferase (TIGR00027 family)
MEEGRPSVTAITAAKQRAAHTLWDDIPRIFDDPLALGLSGVESEDALRASLDAMQAAHARRSTPEVAKLNYRFARAGIVVRQRYAEDALTEAIGHGVAQYVILGAGLDSFAYRRLDLATVLRVFEVDNPTTQQWKHARLRALNIMRPSNLTFIPVNFEEHTLADELHAGGHRSDLPTFFSWLGVTHYLTDDAVFETLDYIASLAAGTEIVFQYFVPEALWKDEDRPMLTLWKDRGNAQGEQVLTMYEPSNLAVRLRERGFTQIWDMGPEEADARYCAGRNDGLRVYPHMHLMKARVGSVTSLKKNSEKSNHT